MELLIAGVTGFLAPGRPALLLLQDIQGGQDPVAVRRANTTTGLPLPHRSRRTTQAAVTVQAIFCGMGLGLRVEAGGVSLPRPGAG